MRLLSNCQLSLKGRYARSLGWHVEDFKGLVSTDSWLPVPWFRTEFYSSHQCNHSFLEELDGWEVGSHCLSQTDMLCWEPAICACRVNCKMQKTRILKGSCGWCVHTSHVMHLQSWRGGKERRLRRKCWCSFPGVRPWLCYLTSLRHGLLMAVTRDSLFQPDVNRNLVKRVLHVIKLHKCLLLIISQVYWSL